MTLRALIVDDEKLARERLRQLLSPDPSVEIVAECRSGREALEAIRQHQPNLVFLDVQMPEMDGFAVLAQLDRDKLPAIIFVTAHDQFALRAFEVNALDYLLKPFDRERLHKAVARARQALQHNSMQDLSRRIQSLLAEANQTPPAAKYPDRLAIKVEGRVLLLKPGEIDWIEAADNYVLFHRGNETHIHRETLSSLETKLDPARFIRISRSVIVNLDRIKELQPMFHGDYVVVLQNGARLALSRSFKEKLPLLFGRT